jgi:hypothetical protein
MGDPQTSVGLDQLNAVAGWSFTEQDHRRQVVDGLLGRPLDVGRPLITGNPWADCSQKSWQRLDHRQRPTLFRKGTRWPKGICVFASAL